MYTFTIMPLLWEKRRLPPKRVTISSAEVKNFTLIDNSKCGIMVTYEDGSQYLVEGTVHENKVYRVGGGVDSSHWSIQAFTEHGGVLLKVTKETI